MFSKIAKYLLPVALAGIATIARADTETFPFTYTTTGSGAQITASGSFTTDGYSSVGNDLAPSDITSWNITFTSPSFLGASFVLDSSNSTFSIGDGTVIGAFPDPNNLIFEAFNAGEGFEVTGTDQFGANQVQVEWLWLDGNPSSIIWVSNPQDNVSIIGSNTLNLDSFPVLFETDSNYGLGAPPPAPTPEPSSLLLFGTGCLFLTAAGAGKLKRIRAPHALGGLLLAAALSIAMPVSAQTSSTPATCNGNDQAISGSSLPCYGNVPDILNGKRRLLVMDDLIVNTNTFNESTQQSYPAGANLATDLKDSKPISSQAPTSISNKSLAPVSNAITIKGRLWAVNHDQVISALVNQNSSNVQSLAISLEPVDNWIGLNPMPAFNNSRTLYGASGDFLGNGYDQMVVVGWQPGQLVMQALAAANTAVQGDGVAAGTPLPISTNSTVFAIAAGVFTQPSGNATGPALQQAQLAVVSTNPSTNTGLQVTFYSVNSALTITQVGSPYPVTLPAGTQASAPITLAMVAGRFNGGNHDQLAIGYPLFPANSNIANAEIFMLDFQASGVPNLQVNSSSDFQITTEAQNGFNAALYLAKGAFNWPTGIDELGISVASGKNSSSIGVMSFDSSLNGTMGTSVTYSPACHFGLAAGNFNTGTFNLQLGDTATDCLGDGSFNLNMYSVDPNTFAVSLLNVTSISNTIGGTGPPSSQGNLAVSLIAGDEQGNSLLLGPPEKLTILSHYQPDVVLEVPPMHVDWAIPNGGTGVGIANITVFPNTFNTTFNFSSSGSGSLSQQTRTSYTYSTKETASESASYGFAGDKVSLMATQAATQLHQNTVSKNYDTNQGSNQTYNFSTVLDDVVSSTQSNLNVYSYPVIGQCDTGPINGDTCPNGGAPLYLQYSGPDNVTYTLNAPGSTDEWYQPVHEPGNLLSYPASVTMLESIVNSQGSPFQSLSPTNVTWSPLTPGHVNVNWNNGSSTGATAGSTSSHSFNTSVSASAKVNYFGFDASVSAGFDYNDSTSISSLNQSINSFGSSLGVTQNFGISTGSLDPAYDYTGNTLIYGQMSNAIQTDLTPPTTVQGQGYIDVGQMADILASESGDQWWKQTYGTTPDIALNHPARWNSKALTAPTTTEVAWENCPYGYSASDSSVECTATTPGQTRVDGYATNPFYLMKGLFITPGGTSNGPQTAIVQQGGSLNLRARVYNYSLANYGPSNSMITEFYAQQYNADTGAFLDNPVGSGQFAQAVFLGTGTTQDGSNTPPSAYCGGVAGESDPCPDSTTPNYEDVYLTWDTTSNPAFAADTYWEIWVVVRVVINSKSSQIVPEPAGHGFSTAPPAVGSFHDPSQVPIEQYSNNLGIYSQVISIIGASATPTAATPALKVAATTPAAKKLTLGKVTTSTTGPILRYRSTNILAPHIVTGDHVDSIFTQYFDGDPANGGNVFDTQHVSHVVGTGQYVDRAMFRPRTCGEHEIYVRAVPMDGTAITAMAKAKFRVTDDPVGLISELITYVKSPSYPRRSRVAMLAALDTAERAFNHDGTEEGEIAMKLLLKFVEDGGFDLPKDVREPIANSIKDLLGCL